MNARLLAEVELGPVRDGVDHAGRDDLGQRGIDESLPLEGSEALEYVSDGDDLVATAAAIHLDVAVVESGLDEALDLVGIHNARGFRFVRGAAVYTSAAERSRQEALRDMGEVPLNRRPRSIAPRVVEGPCVNDRIDIPASIPGLHGTGELIPIRQPEIDPIDDHVAHAPDAVITLPH